MTRNEARAFAFEAYFQIKEMGFSVIRVGGDEEAQLRASGLLKHIPEQSIDECGLKARILKKCTLQEFAHDKRDLHNFAWPDSRVFLEDAGSDVDALPSRECKVAWQNAFEQAILDEYAVISSAFMESKVRLAIDELGALIRGFQAAEGFVPDHRCIGARLSAKNQLLNKEQHHA
jgi:hypothetical protein